MEQYDVFFSYSSCDGDLVAGVTSLLRISGRRVFLDADSIEPGKHWPSVLSSAICSSSKVVIFWCCHSAQSEYVEHELRWSRDESKPIVPVLLCDEPRPDWLAEIQWVDLRKCIHHKCHLDHVTSTRLRAPQTDPRLRAPQMDPDTLPLQPPLPRGELACRARLDDYLQELIQASADPSYGYIDVARRNLGIPEHWSDEGLWCGEVEQMNDDSKVLAGAVFRALTLPDHQLKFG